jgi:NitT/TauT family transport system substrate-binding protein
MISLPNSGAMGAAVAGGSIDVALGNPISIANARAQGLPFYIFAPAAMYDTAEPAALLTVAKNSPVASAKDLEGKTIATIELRGIMQASIRSWMTTRKADPANTRFIELSFSTMATALAAGRVDAAMIAEPALTLARPSVRIIGDPYSAVAKQWMSTVWYTTQDRLAKNPDEIRTFASIMTRTAAWADSHRSETGVVIANLMSLPADVVAKMARVRFAERLDPKFIQPVLDTAFSYGILKSPVAARDLFAPGFS